MSIFSDIFSTIKKAYYGLTSPLQPYNKNLYELEKAKNPDTFDIVAGIENISSDAIKGVEKAIVEPIKKILPEISSWFKIILYGIILGVVIYLFFRKK